MALNDILTSMDGARDALVTAINNKGGSLSQDSTLYQCANAIGSIESGGTDTTDATAGAGDILSGKTAYVNGEKITGTINSYTGSSLIIPGVEDKVLSTAEGIYLPKAVKVAGESELLAENIKKGVSIFGIVGTLDSGGGSSAEYYKCASVSSGTGAVLEGRLLTMSFIDVIDFDYATEPTVIHFTMTDTTKTGLDREWVSSDGVYMFKKYVNTAEGYISWGLYKNSDNTYSHYITTGLIDQNKMTTDAEGNTVDMRDPWEIKQLYSEAGFMDTKEISWVHSQEAVGGKTWSGYKAVQQENGGYTFEETVTTGLTYTTITPVVDSIYTADCMVRVGYMVPAASASIPDDVIFHLPLVDSLTFGPNSIPDRVYSNKTLEFRNEQGIPCAYLDGENYIKVNKMNANNLSCLGSTNKAVTYSCWAKVSNSETGTLFAFSYTPHFFLNSSRVFMSTDKGESFSMGFDLDATVWHNYVFVGEGKFWRIYVDGVSMISENHNDYISAEREWAFIGCHSYNNSVHRITGCITAARLYNRVLSDAEILALAGEFTPTA